LPNQSQLGLLSLLGYYANKSSRAFSILSGIRNILTFQFSQRGKANAAQDE